MAANLKRGQLDDTKIEYINENASFRVIRNPYIVIIGISTYKQNISSQSEYILFGGSINRQLNKSLNAVKTDIKKMKKLWKDIYKYKHVSIASDVIGSSFISMQTLNRYINQRVAEIQLHGDELNVDGLIFIYSGHGDNDGSDNYIISSDHKRISLTEIQDKFSKTCDYLNNKPKIFYMDTCRGNEDIEQDAIKQLSISKGNESSTIYVNKLTNFYVHFSSTYNHKSWTKNEEYGSHLIGAVYQCYNEQYENHQKKAITLNDTSNIINLKINKSSKGQQTSEILHRLMYDVYITSNDDINKEPLSRIALLEEIKILKLKNMAMEQKLNEQMILNMELEEQLFSNGVEQNKTEYANIKEKDDINPNDDLYVNQYLRHLHEWPTTKNTMDQGYWKDIKKSIDMESVQRDDELMQQKLDSARANLKDFEKDITKTYHFYDSV